MNFYLSLQACLGEVKKDKGSESVSLYLNIEGKKLVLGTLNSEKLPQQLFDLVFDRNFELSHSWKNGSVYFYGYKAANHDQYPFLSYACTFQVGAYNNYINTINLLFVCFP